MLNKNQIEEVKSGLLQLNFSDKETAVYLSILQNSNSSIPSIARETGLSRATVYDLVEKLKTESFVAETKKGKKRTIVAESPTNRFYKLLDDKHSQLEKSKQIVENILPAIKAINATEDFKPQIRVYAGEQGFRKVWDEILAYEGKNFLSIARIETYLKFMGQDFLTEIQERKVKLGFTSRAINETSPEAEKMKLNDKKYSRETKLVPKDFQFPSSEIIFGDKIAMFSTREEDTIVVIESKDFADTHRAYFEMLWKFLEK